MHFHLSSEHHHRVNMESQTFFTDETLEANLPTDDQLKDLNIDAIINGDNLFYDEIAPSTATECCPIVPPHSVVPSSVVPPEACHTIVLSDDDDGAQRKLLITSNLALRPTKNLNIVRRSAEEMRQAEVDRSTMLRKRLLDVPNGEKENSSNIKRSRKKKSDRVLPKPKLPAEQQQQQPEINDDLNNVLNLTKALQTALFEHRRAVAEADQILEQSTTAAKTRRQRVEQMRAQLQHEEEALEQEDQQVELDKVNRRVAGGRLEDVENKVASVKQFFNNL